jgi:glycosyltransferase involved in cell wall biosynthesis
MKLGVAVIVRNEERDLPKMLESIKDVADVLYVLDCGSTDRTPNLVSTFSKINQHIKCFSHTYTKASEQISGQWLMRDFSKARNKCLESIEQYCDYVLVLDADDVLLDGKELRRVIEAEGPAIFGCIIKRTDSNSDFRSHRCWPSKAGVRYVGAVHEYPHANGLRLCDINVRILHSNKEDKNQENGNERNLRIFKAEYAAGKRDNRTLFYYAKTLQDMARWQEASDLYGEYINNETTFWDERRLAYLYRIRCMRAVGNLNEAIPYGWLALSEDRALSEVMVEMAEMYLELKEYDKATGLCYMALQTPPISVLWINKDCYELKPWKMISEIFLIKNGMKT